MQRPLAHKSGSVSHSFISVNVEILQFLNRNLGDITKRHFTLALTVDSVTGFQTELSEQIRRRRWARLTVWSPSGSHRTATVGFCYGFVGYDAHGVTASADVIDTPAVQQMSVAISDSGILWENNGQIFYIYIYNSLVHFSNTTSTRS